MSAEAPAPADGRGGRTSLRSVESFFLRYAMIFVLIGVVIGARITYDRFLTIDNIRNVLSQNASVGIIAIGMTIVMISGGFDLSVYATFAAGSTFFVMFSNAGFTLVIAAVLAILIGCAFGLINGLIITKLNVNAFIATLGSGAVFLGVVFLMSNSEAQFATDPNFGILNDRGPLSLTWSVWLMFLLFVIGAFVMAKMNYGRSIYAIGGNPEAARLAGLPVNRISISAFVIVGGCAAIGGLILASTLGVGQATQGTANITLDAIAVVVVGGTSLYGGVGSVWRTAIGVLILGSLNNLLGSLSLGAPNQSIVKGVVIIAAVAIDAYSRRREGLSG